MSALAATFAGICLLVAAQGSAGIPKNDGWVTDLAGMIPQPREQALEASMEAFRAGASGAEIAVLTVPSLNGEPIERFALETARAWGIGTKDTHKGALLLISAQDRELRIETGRGVEGDLPDAIAHRIIQQMIVPKLKAGDPAGAIETGVQAIHDALGGDYGAIPAAPIPARRASRGFGTSMIIFLIIAIALSRRRRQGRGPRGPFGGLGFPIGVGLGGLASRGGGFSRGGSSGGGFSGFGGGGGFSGGGASGRW